jgi:hypothetical protein
MARGMDGVCSRADHEDYEFKTLKESGGSK